MLLTGCPLAVDDPYEIRRPDAAAATGGSAGTAASSGSGGCSDGLKNGNETAKDCGGNACPPCADGLACNQDSDCQSDSCPSDICAPQ